MRDLIARWGGIVLAGFVGHSAGQQNRTTSWLELVTVIVLVVTVIEVIRLGVMLVRVMRIDRARMVISKLAETGEAEVRTRIEHHGEYLTEVGGQIFRYDMGPRCRSRVAMPAIRDDRRPAA